MTLLRDSLLMLASHFAQRRDAILEAWRERVTNDPKLTTGAALPRALLQDHLPALLEDFEHRLGAADASARAAAKDEQKGDAAAHGMHRWQQGFDLSEVTRELGRLNQCVVDEIERCATSQPPFLPSALAEARRIWADVPCARAARMAKRVSASNSTRIGVAISSINRFRLAPGWRARVFSRSCLSSGRRKVVALMLELVRDRAV